MHADILDGLSGCGEALVDIFLSVKLTAGPVEPDGIARCAVKADRVVGKAEITHM